MAGAPSGTSSSSCHSTGWRMNGSVCGPPSPPCEPISSSNAATSPSSGLYWLSSSRSGAWAIASSRLRLMIVCGPNRVVGSSPSTRSWSRIARALRAEDDRAESASSGPAASRRPGGPRPPRRGPDGAPRAPRPSAGGRCPVNQTSPRLPEPTTAIVDASATAAAPPRVVEVDDAVGRLARQRGAGDGRADALALGDLRQERVDEGRPLGLGLRLDDRRPAAHQARGRTRRGSRRSAAGTSRRGSGRGRTGR